MKMEKIMKPEGWSDEGDPEDWTRGLDVGAGDPDGVAGEPNVDQTRWSSRWYKWLGYVMAGETSEIGESVEFSASPPPACAWHWFRSLVSRSEKEYYDV